MTPVYVDSSVLLRLLLREKGAWEGWAASPARLCSELAEVECLRTLDRLRLLHGLPEHELIARRSLVYVMLESMEVIQVTRSILRRASESFPVALGTLDAIHLATALAWQEAREATIAMATHDEALTRAARAYGIETIG